MKRAHGEPRRRRLAVHQEPRKDTRISSEYFPICHLTRGSDVNEWHVWNVSPLTLSLRARDEVRLRVVNRDLESGPSVVMRSLSDFAVQGSSSGVFVVDRDIRFHPDPKCDEGLSFSSGLSHAVDQSELLRVCRDKGVSCSLFLSHYVSNPLEDDEELRLGSELHALLVASVKEMLSRKYDIMHHYAVFDRALALYYAKETRSEPPGLKEMTESGGWLDRSAYDHLALHGIPLVGSDHVSFSRWKYPEDDERSPWAYSERPDGRACIDGKGDSLPDLTAKGDSLPDLTGRQPGNIIHEVSGSPPEDPGSVDTGGADGGSGDDDNYVDGTGTGQGENTGEPGFATATSTSWGIARGVEETYHVFNNLEGTLTDGPKAFPYAFVVRAGEEPCFADLVDYCLKRVSGPFGPLPARERWGSINPVLLMEDPVDADTGRVSRRYTVTSRGYLSTLLTSSHPTGTLPTPCYNEVFLPGRPVSRLNLDLDLKCCKQCNVRFSRKAETSVKTRVCEAIVSSLLMAITESLLRLARVKSDELQLNSEALRNVSGSLGKFATYQRTSVDKSKLSLRVLWYLPTELCSFVGIEAYKPLLEELEKRSLGYAVLSYPADATRCGLCDLKNAMGGQGGLGFSWLRLSSSDRSAGRRSAVDRAPYAFRKCVRLPNCRKDSFAFEYVGTFNARDDIEDAGFEDPRSISVGLSSNPVTSDVTSLGSRFERILEARGSEWIASLGPEANRLGAPSLALAEREAQRLSELWGVPVTVRTSGSGLLYVQANERSETYPCPIHKRIHSKTRLCALIFEAFTRAKCFVV